MQHGLSPEVADVDLTKSKRSLRANDEAVSPVIATILMVAITVVLAATVYIWVSGFGANQPQAVSASFSAKPIDTNKDTKLDTIDVVYVTGLGEIASTEAKLFIDGVEVPLASVGDQWTPGESERVPKGPGIYSVRVAVREQVVLDTQVTL